MVAGDRFLMGGNGSIVEIDETFIGQKKDMPKRRGYAHEHAVMTLIQRGGKSRSFHVEGTSAAAHDSPHFQMALKVSAKTGSSASIAANRWINGMSRRSGIVGINS